jgi:hypothetical protein
MGGEIRPKAVFAESRPNAVIHLLPIVGSVQRSWPGHLYDCTSDCFTSSNSIHFTAQIKRRAAARRGGTIFLRTNVHGSSLD